MNDLYPCLWFDNQAEGGGGRRGDPELRLVEGQVRSLSWQIVQTALQEGHEALLQMGKLDLQDVKNAAAA